MKVPILSYFQLLFYEISRTLFFPQHRCSSPPWERKISAAVLTCFCVTKNKVTEIWEEAFSKRQFKVLAGVSRGAVAVLELMWWWEVPTRTGDIRRMHPLMSCVIHVHCWPCSSFRHQSRLRMSSWCLSLAPLAEQTQILTSLGVLPSWELLVKPPADVDPQFWLYEHFLSVLWDCVGSCS